MVADLRGTSTIQVDCVDQSELLAERGHLAQGATAALLSLLIAQGPGGFGPDEDGIARLVVSEHHAAGPACLPGEGVDRRRKWGHLPVMAERTTIETGGHVPLHHHRRPHLQRELIGVLRPAGDRRIHQRDMAGNLDDETTHRHTDPSPLLGSDHPPVGDHQGSAFGCRSLLRVRSLVEGTVHPMAVGDAVDDHGDILQLGVDDVNAILVHGEGRTMVQRGQNHPSPLHRHAIRSSEQVVRTLRVIGVHQEEMGVAG